jgi:hypothetical protein
MKCSCGGAAQKVPAQTFYRREPFARREHCCAECSQGIARIAPAAGYFYPGGGDAASDAAAQRAREAQAAAQRAREAQAAREAADRDAALRGVSTVTGGVQTVVSETQATERARIEAEARLAATRAESQAATERARIEAQRDLELARIRSAESGATVQERPTFEVLPSTSTTAPAPVTVTPRTDSGAGSFPVVPVAIGVGIAGAIYFLTRKKGRR